MAAARGRKSSVRSKRGSEFHANLIAGTWKGRGRRRWQEDWPGALGERGVVPYLQPRAHKCILTDASESRARPRRACHTSHWHANAPTYPMWSTGTRQCPAHTAHTHNRQEAPGIRATRRGKRRTTPATLFHEHNLHYRAVQPVNSDASRGAPPPAPHRRRRHLNIFNMQRTRSAN